jgi:hypothetical protein
MGIVVGTVAVLIALLVAFGPEQRGVSMLPTQPPARAGEAAP